MPFLPAESAEPPRVTVFIPTWNGGPLFDEVLREICAQETAFPFEVLAIDSGSKDGTLDVLAKHRVRVLRIPNSEFNHGLTRNRAVQEARGEIVVLTVQDATPASRDWLATLVADFGDPEVVGRLLPPDPAAGLQPVSQGAAEELGAAARDSRACGRSRARTRSGRCTRSSAS